MSDEQGPTPPQAPAPPAAPESTRKRILAVDDEPSARLLISRVLHRAGYEVTAAASAEEALELFDKGRKFDLLITDKNLPRINGLELIKKARQAIPDLPVVLITAAPDAAAIGGERLEAYLAKPFKNLNALEEAVRTAFEANKLHLARQEMQRTLNDLVSQLQARNKTS
ncbi:MAG TPA: response regulator [Myxococcales bacterium]|nr:response regulator [Myxococcales bacterium]